FFCSELSMSQLETFHVLADVCTYAINELRMCTYVSERHIVWWSLCYGFSFAAKCLLSIKITCDGCYNVCSLFSTVIYRNIHKISTLAERVLMQTPSRTLYLFNYNMAVILWPTVLAAAILFL